MQEVGGSIPPGSTNSHKYLYKTTGNIFFSSPIALCSHQQVQTQVQAIKQEAVTLSKCCPNYLHRSEYYIFYYRRAIPRALKAYFPNKEIRRSLNTRIKSEALLYSAIFNAKVDAIFDKMRGGDMGIDPKNILGFQISGYNKHADGSVTFESLMADKDSPADKEMMQAFLNHLAEASPAPTPLPQFAPQDAPQTPLQPIPVAAAETKATSMHFSELVDLFSKEKKDDYRVSTMADFLSIFNVFKSFLGDMRIDKINHQTIFDFIHQLKRTPPNAKKKKPDKSLKQIAAMKNTGKSMSVVTINKYLTRLSTLFNFAIELDLMPTNYAAKKKLKDTVHPQDKAHPFTAEELQRMFHSNLYVNNPSKKGMEPKFWAMLIALFTGMRQGEIAQLRVDDIYQYTDEEDDMTAWVIDNRENAELKKRLKTHASRRIVPIHSELIKIGFLEYVDQRRQGSAESPMLFAGLTYTEKSGWARKIERTTNYFIKTTMGITGKSFHSFRHTAITQLTRSGMKIPLELRVAVVGHSQEGVHLETYNAGFPLKDLIRTVEALRYPKLDLSHLYREVSPKPTVKTNIA